MKYKLHEDIVFNTNLSKIDSPDLFTEVMDSNIKNLPELPRGFFWSFSSSWEYNEETNNFDVKVIATPKSIIEIGD